MAIFTNSQTRQYQNGGKLNISESHWVKSDSLQHHGPHAHQASLSIDFPRPEYWNGWLFLSPRDLLNPGVEPRSLALQADSLPSEPPGKHKLSILTTKLILAHMIYLNTLGPLKDNELEIKKPEFYS